MTRNKILIGVFLLLGLLAVQALWLLRVFNASQDQFSERVDLALRKTSQDLLRDMGDSTVILPPVERTADYAWRIRFYKQFDYQCLPPLLNDALREQDIEGNYEVSVNDCYDNNLILGYASSTSNEPVQAACDTRAHPFGCFYLTLVFTDRHVVPFRESVVRKILLGVLLLALAFGLYRLAFRRKHLPEASVENSGLRFSRSELFTEQLRLTVAGQSKSLTYREARLLEFLANRPNLLLQRDEIVQAVWDEEGAGGGRSLDVFISRLRKLLQEDERIRIVNVHGQGYRLEIRED